MKKYVFFLLSLAFLTLMVIPSSAEKIGGKKVVHSGKQNERTKIKKEDLPEPVRKTLEGDAFKGWTTEGAYKTKDGEYEVDLKKGNTLQTIKFDKDGKVK